MFQTINANIYDVAVVTSDFSKGMDLQECSDNTVDVDFLQGAATNYLHGNSSIFADLTPMNCLKVYDTPFVTNIAEVLVVTSESGGTNSSASIIFGPATNWAGSSGQYRAEFCVDNLRNPPKDVSPGSPKGPFVGTFIGNYVDGWACTDRLLDCTDEVCQSSVNQCTASSIAAEPGNWTMNGYQVKNCLARRTAEKCSVQFVVPILIVVIISNTCKAICMVAALSLEERPLLTQGDAIDSFLSVPDAYTENRCLWTRGMITDVRNARSGKTHDKDAILPVQWQRKRLRWFQAATIRTWITCILP